MAGIRPMETRCSIYGCETELHFEDSNKSTKDTSKGKASLFTTQRFCRKTVPCPFYRFLVCWHLRCLGRLHFFLQWSLWVNVCSIVDSTMEHTTTTRPPWANGLASNAVKKRSSQKPAATAKLEKLYLLSWFSERKRKGTLFKCLVDLALEHTNWGHCKVKLTINVNQVQ